MAKLCFVFRQLDNRIGTVSHATAVYIAVLLYLDGLRRCYSVILEWTQTCLAPLTHHAHQLVSSVPPQETVKHWTQTRWAESWASTTTRLHTCMPTPSNSGQGVGLSRRAWTRLNRLRTGVGRFGANMLRWGLSTNDCCECGAEQTAEHITSGRCPIYRPPEGIHGLI